VTTSGKGVVGDASWDATHTGVESGASSDDANVQFNDIAVPYTSGSTMAGGTYMGTNYAYLLNSTGSPYYLNGSITLNGGQTMMIVGSVTLYVTGSFATAGNGMVIIAPGGSLKLYVGGSISVTGNGIVNMTGLPSNLAIYGLPTCTSINCAGTSAFQGTVYAPEANFTFAGGADAFGAFTANTITVVGNGNVHYDEALGAAKVYLVASWNEVAP